MAPRGRGGADTCDQDVGDRGTEEQCDLDKEECVHGRDSLVWGQAHSTGRFTIYGVQAVGRADLEVLRQMEVNAPKGLAELIAALDRLIPRR